ncbi:MAG TPA: hypothetical protein VGV68_13195 [Terriglobia bacterium]|nr:hypothetical protein [Terriglobia bacterium]
MYRLCTLGLLPMTLSALADGPYSDSFEAATLSPFWTATQGNGVVQASATKSHTGAQSLQMARTGGGQLNLALQHTYSAAQYGTVTVWFYDDATRYGYYSYLAIGNTGLGLSSSLGVQDWDATHYYYQPLNGTGGTVPSISRSVGWHEIAFVVTRTNQTMSFDGQPIYTGANTAHGFGVWKGDRRMGAGG